MRSRIQALGAVLLWLAGSALVAGESATITEWPLPERGAGPGYLALDGHGGFWFTEQDAARLAHFDPATGALIEWQDPSPFLDFGISVDPAGLVWIAVWSRALLRFDPVTGRFDSFDIPTAFPLPFMVHVDNHVCTTQFRRNVVGCLDPSALEWSEWPLPPTLASPEGLTATGDGSLWIGANGGRRLARLDRASGLLTAWPIPDAGALRLQIAPDALGRIWFPLQESGGLANLDPRTDELTMYSLPNPLSEPFAIEPDLLGRIWFSESGRSANAIGRLDPWNVAGVVLQVEPEVMALDVRIAPSRKVTWGVEEPVIHLLEGVTTGVESTFTDGIHEWPLATPDAGPGDLALDDRGRVLFLEYAGDRVALLTLDPDAVASGVVDLLKTMVDQLLDSSPPGATGLVRKLEEIAAIAAEAADSFADGSISVETYQKRLRTALDLVHAFEQQLRAKIDNGQLGEPLASELTLSLEGIERSIAGLISDP